MTLEELVRRAGIGISTIRLSEVTSKGRIDAEYYHPEKAHVQIQLSGLTGKTIGEYFVPIREIYVPDTFDDAVVLNFDLNDALNPILTESTQPVIAGELGSLKKRFKKGDVVISRLRSYLKEIAIVDAETNRNVFGSSEFIALRPKQNVSSELLLAYLNSNAVQTILKWSQDGSNHPRFQEEELLSIKLPDAVIRQMGKINNLTRQAIKMYRESEQLYAEAERLLAAELGLDRLDLGESLFNVRRMSDVQLAGRVDAEYFKPKYERLLEYLQQTGQAARLNDVVREPLRRGVQPEYAEDGEILVINSQHVGKTHVELEDNRRTTNDFCADRSNKRAVVHKGDVLMNSTGYITIGRAQTLLENVQAMVDGHVTIIRPKDGLDPVYLGLFLNSQSGQLQTERGWTGSSGQIELRTEVIGNFLVWKAPMPIQLKIRELVETAHQARQETKRLLAEAKSEVERLIESGDAGGVL